MPRNLADAATIQTRNNGFADCIEALAGFEDAVAGHVPLVSRVAEARP